MPQIYETDAHLDILVRNLVSNISFSEFSPLREHNVRIGTCLRYAVKDEEEVACGDAVVETKKVTPLNKLFMAFDYLIVVDKVLWEGLGDIKQHAFLHKALMKIEVKINDSGEVKLGMREPEIQEFAATLNRFGAYTQELETINDLVSRVTQASVDQIMDVLMGRGERVADEEEEVGVVLADGEEDDDDDPGGAGLPTTRPAPRRNEAARPTRNRSGRTPMIYDNVPADAHEEVQVRNRRSRKPAGVEAGEEE